MLRPARFFAWRWWRGWRGWLIFACVAVVASSFAAVGLGQAFAPPPEPWSKFPGVPQVSTDQVLSNQTVDQLEPRVDAAMADVRAALTAEFGFDWVPKGKAVVEYESNRYHGTSLLNTYDSVNWQTTTTLRSIADKKRAVATVTKIMEAHGFGSPQLQNVVGADGLQEFGDFTLKQQGRWVLAGQPPRVSRGSLELTIFDLSHDRVGVLAAASKKAVVANGWEPEYVSIAYHGGFMLKAADRAEFERRSALYVGHIAPVPGRNTD